MIGADAVAPSLDGLPPGSRDPDPGDLDRLLASLDHLALCCCEPGADEAREHLPTEAMTMDEKRLVSAILAIGQNL
jgi:hypothetical protein